LDVVEGLTIDLEVATVLRHSWSRGAKLAIELLEVPIVVAVVVIAVVIAVVAVVVVVISSISTVCWLYGEINTVVIPASLSTGDQDRLVVSGSID